MKNKLYLLGIALLACILGFIGYKNITQTEYIKLGYAMGDMSAIWYTTIAESINSTPIKLEVSGKTADIKKGQLYMDTTMSLMIPVDAISDIFDCAVNVYDTNKLIIEKGTNKVTILENEIVMHVNESEINIKTAMIWKLGVLYVPAEVLKNGLAYSYIFDVKTNTAIMMDSNSDARTIPYAYNYTLIGKSPVVKDQGKYGTCWAFASLTALETTLMPEEKLEFSEDHMSLNNSFSMNQSEGGDYTMSIAYLSAWQGPVLEIDDPYGDGKSDNKLKAVKHVQEVQIVESKDYEAIKKMVYKYGGVQSSLYLSLRSPNGYSVFYNKKNYAYCYIGTDRPNHDIVIIGWDDNYPKENFNADIENDGAFICRNSWGSKFGDSGNFYVSYYDTNIGMHNVVYTKVEDNDNYNNIYQSDLCGWVGNMGYGSDTAYFANVYTAKGNEDLQAVSFYATGLDTSYVVYVVKDFQDSDSFSKRGISVASGKLNNSGYYTIDLKNSISLNKGEKYAILVKIVTPNSGKPIAIEYHNDYRTASFDINDGEGYVSWNGNNWENTESRYESNVCLKAFTNNR